MGNDSSELQVTIATQPYEDSVRREYVRTLLDALKTLPLGHSVVLKIHPSESPSFYSNLLTEYPDIEMKTNAICRNLNESNLLITINSNVGIEAMIRDGCCLSFNMWEPVTPVSPYVELGPVPLSTTRAELTEFLSSLDETTYDRLRERQASFVADDAELDDCTTQIATQIQGTD